MFIEIFSRKPSSYLFRVFTFPLLNHTALFSAIGLYLGIRYNSRDGAFVWVTVFGFVFVHYAWSVYQGISGQRFQTIRMVVINGCLKIVYLDKKKVSTLTLNESHIISLETMRIRYKYYKLVVYKKGVDAPLLTQYLQAPWTNEKMEEIISEVNKYCPNITTQKPD